MTADLDAQAIQMAQDIAADSQGNREYVDRMKDLFPDWDFTFAGAMPGRHCIKITAGDGNVTTGEASSVEYAAVKAVDGMLAYLGVNLPPA